MKHVDPPDLALRQRCAGFPLWWEQRRLVGLGLACALAFTTLSITIPILIQRVVDEAIVGTHDDRLLPYLGLIVRSRPCASASTSPVRDRAVGIAVEARLRGMLYHAYLTYPRAFFDRHATGEVISRATNDIYPVRYFIGWGVVQGIQSAMMITGAAIVLVAVNARLALYAALAMPPIAILTWFFAHRLFPISRLVQARKGNLAEATDEAVVGSRWCRPSAARRTCARVSSAGPRRCATRRCERRRSRRTSSPGSSSCPRSGSRPSSSAAAT